MLQKIWPFLSRLQAPLVRAPRASGLHQALLTMSGVGVILTFLVGLHWSRELDQFDVISDVNQRLVVAGFEAVTGSTTAAALIGVAETLLEIA